MVVIAQPYRFDETDPRPMLRHLDNWSRHSLTSPEGWGSMLERCGQWADYSARNQALLASYAVVGPVAGTATWDQVPSSEPGRPCAVRVGEHGLPVRVPVIDGGDIDSDRSRMGARSVSVAGGHRWEPVFALEQLARKPALGALAPVAVPRLTPVEWVEAVRVATGRVIGRMPRKIDDPAVQLVTLAGRVPHGPGRIRLTGELAAQAGWLVAARVGLDPGPMPAFDPTVMGARERWRTLVDVRHATGQLTVGLSHALGVDLAASPLPRHELVDDRTVAAGRRNYLAPADLRALPVGVWVEAGPYTKGEWLARGIAGAVGTATFQRVNDRSYLAAYETRQGAMWRLETTGRGAHNGLVHQGTTDTLTAAKDAARTALRERFPDIADAIDTTTTSRVVSARLGWTPLPGGLDDRTEQRVFDERVTATIAPGPGGRWQTWTTIDGSLRQGPLAADAASARDVADGLARRAVIEVAANTPDRANHLIRDLAAHPETWDRQALVAVVGHRLTDKDRNILATTGDPTQLVDTMVAAGVLAPSTMMSVLHAEHIDANTATSLVPAIGLPVPDAIRQLHHDWATDRLDTAAALGATTDELRAAGCTPVEMLAAKPRETLRSLDTREHTWELVGPSLLEAGYTAAETVDHLAAHAPTPETFAAAVTTIIDNPIDAFTYASRRAEPSDLAALSERYGLNPEQTAATLTTVGVPLGRAVETVHLRCDHDIETTYQLATEVIGVSPAFVSTVLAGEMPEVIDITHDKSIETPDWLDDTLVAAGVGIDGGVEL